MLSHLQYRDTEPVIPSLDPRVPVIWQGSHHSTNSSVTHISYLPLLLRSQLYFWGSPLLSCFFCIPSCTSGVHHYYYASSAFPAISLGFIITIILLRSQLYLLGSPFFFFFFCVPSHISGVHHSSSSAFPAISLGFIITIILLLHSQLYLLGSHYSSSSAFSAILWGSPFFFFFCIPSYISRVHHSSSSSSAFQAISLGFTISGEVSAYVTIF